MKHRVTIHKGAGGYRLAMKTLEGKIVCSLFMDLGGKTDDEEQIDAFRQANALVNTFAEAVREKLSGQVE